MGQTYYFYDLETSGLNPRDDRIMQFAGIRTDENLQPIGESHNVLIRLTEDILPSPGAIQVTGITPQMTLADGMNEPEFCRFLIDEVFIPNTVTIGFNNVRFDDEFIRHTLWRNFYDPYEWAWSEGRSRWDMLDVVRLTRALRPDGIEWPVDENGTAVNKLELLTKANGLAHEKAHDALSDVEGLIAVTKLIKDTQPKLFNYMFSMRNKKSVATLAGLEDPKPFVYAAGRYDSQYEKATVVIPIAPGRTPGSVVVYDLRVDPTPFVAASAKQLHAAMTATKEERLSTDFQPVPVNELSFNKCPAIAPLGVLDEGAKSRIGIDIASVENHLKVLGANPGFGSAVREALSMRESYPEATDVEHTLYDGFIPDTDKKHMQKIRSATADDLADFNPRFTDTRFDELLFRYKARYFPSSLTEDEQKRWQDYRQQKITTQMPSFVQELQKIAGEGADSFLVEELQLWAENTMPEDI